MGQLLTVSEVALRLRCRQETIRRYIIMGRLPALVLPDGRYRIREEDLAALLKPVGVSEAMPGPR